MKPNTVETFWERVDVRGDDECWEWRGSLFSGGYGQFVFNGKPRIASRFAYELVHGEGSLDGRLACHRCDNRACCNPGHLYAGDYSDNANDRYLRERSPSVSGDRNPMAKLNRDQVDMIREMLASGMRGNMIAEQFGVTNSTISQIKTGKRWGPGLGGVGHESSHQESR